MLSNRTRITDPASGQTLDAATLYLVMLLDWQGWDQEGAAQPNPRAAGHPPTAGTYDRRVDDIGFYVIRWANMPAALVEVAFLSNPVDRARLLSATFRRNAAIGIADGIERYLATDPIQPREPRIAGGDRYETAAKAALTGWPDGAETVIVASGEQWPDSLAAAPLSKRLGITASRSVATSER